MKTTFDLKLKNFIVILISNTLSSIAINGFFIPNALLSGGIGGISIMIEYLTNIHVGIVVFFINIPLFIYGFKKVDRSFAIYGLISMLTFSTLLNLTTGLGKLVNIQDAFISSVIGGVLNGIGVGLLFKNKMCQDGLDILVVDIQTKYNISVGTSLLIINSTIVLISSLLFDLRLALYTIVGIFINSRVLDKVRIGLNIKKSIFIMSDKVEVLSEKITENVSRSVTFLEGMGSYKREKKTVIYVVINNNDVVKIKSLVNEIDASAFIAISDVVEVKGSTFTNV